MSWVKMNHLTVVTVALTIGVEDTFAHQGVEMIVY